MRVRDRTIDSRKANAEAVGMSKRQQRSMLYDANVPRKEFERQTESLDCARPMAYI